MRLICYTTPSFRANLDELINRLGCEILVLGVTMALLVISGQPCSGKSTVAAALKHLLADKGLEVIIINEPGLSMMRNQSYKGDVTASWILCYEANQQQLMN